MIFDIFYFFPGEYFSSNFFAIFIVIICIFIYYSKQQSEHAPDVKNQYKIESEAHKMLTCSRLKTSRLLIKCKCKLIQVQTNASAN